MVKRVLRQRNFLKSLIKNSPLQRKALIRTATPEQIKSIRESILNVANRNVPIPKKTLKKLKPFRKVLTRLAFSNPSERTSKKLLVQRGGFLGVLLPAVLSFVASSLANG